MSIESADGIQSTEWTVEALATKVESLEDTIEQQSDRISQLEDTVDEQSARLDAMSAAKDHTHSRIDDVDERLSDVEGGSEGNTPVDTEDDSEPAQTPLEQITNIPEEMVSDQLTENQERSRFIAKDVRDYADKRLGDWVLSSKDLRRVLSAKEQSSIHYTTVKRVIQFLDDLGGEDVTVKDRHGTIVCFSPEIVDRIENQGEVTGVVTTNTGMV